MLALFVVLLAFYRKRFASWLIIFALVLLLLPALMTAFVLAQRLAGFPAMVSGWSIFAQQTPILAQAIVCTVLFAAAASLAWLLHAGPHASSPIPSLNCPRWLRTPATAGLLALWLFSLVNFQAEFGGSIFSSSYQSVFANGALFYSGMFGLLPSISLMILETESWHWSRPHRALVNFLWLVEFAVFLAQGKRGFILFGAAVLLLMRVHSFPRQAAVLLLCGVLGVPFLSFIAVFRQLAASNTIQFSSIVDLTASHLLNLENVGDMGDFALSTADGIYMIESGRSPLLLGKTYFDYIPRLLPSATRGGLATQAGDEVLPRYGVTANGGMTAVSEAYFNFSWWGCAFVGFVTGWLIAWLHRRRLQSPSPFWVCIYTLAVANAFNGFLYDMFDILKAEFVLLLILAAVYLLNQLAKGSPAVTGVAAALR